MKICNNGFPTTFVIGYVSDDDGSGADDAVPADSVTLDHTGSDADAGAFADLDITDQEGTG